MWWSALQTRKIEASREIPTGGTIICDLKISEPQCVTSKEEAKPAFYIQQYLAQESIPVGCVPATTR